MSAAFFVPVASTIAHRLVHGLTCGLTGALVLLAANGASAETPDGELTPNEVVSSIHSDITGSLGQLSQSGHPRLREFDVISHEIETTLAFAEQAFARGDNVLGADALVLVRGLANMAQNRLLDETISVSSNKFRVPGRNMRKEDIANVHTMLQSMAANTFPVAVDIDASTARLRQGGFDFAAVDNRLYAVNLTSAAALSAADDDLKKFQVISTALKDVLANPSWQKNVSSQLGRIIQTLGPTIQQVAESLKSIEAGDFVHKLDGISRDLGFDSFEALIDAVNQKYGTNYDANAIKGSW